MTILLTPPLLLPCLPVVYQHALALHLQAFSGVCGQRDGDGVEVPAALV
jgi:hypothetical protein